MILVASSGGFKPNQRGLDELQRRLQKEFDKRPMTIPVQTDPRSVVPPAASVVNNYHGPVVTVNGDRAQIAWDNESVTQNQTSDIAPGYEDLARLLTELLAELEGFALTPDDHRAVTDEAEAMLAEVTKEKPDVSLLRRGATFVKGLLAPIATGVAKATTEASTKLAGQYIHTLTTAMDLLPPS